jgi:peptidyl-prolyl cis-trans isomerase C
MRTITPHALFSSTLITRRWRGIVLALSLSVVLPATGWTQASDPVVARVNGAEIRASDLAVAEEDIGQNIPQMPAEQRREYLITFLSDMALAAQAAEAKKLADTPEFKQRLAYMRNKLLMDRVLKEQAEAATTDAALKSVYEEAAKQIASEQEVRARHILVENEDEAKAIAGDLKKGGDFTEMAKQKSKDTSSAEGGDLGYFTKEQMVPEFSEVAFKLAPGEVSEPVKSQFGWHVIKVEDKRNRQPPPFDQVKDQIETFVVRRAQADSITKLRAGAKIERLDPKPENAPAAEPKKN